MEQTIYGGDKMFGILILRREKPKNRLQALCLRLWRRSAVTVRCDHVGMAMFRVAEVTVPCSAGPWLLRRRLQGALAWLRQNGVHRVIAPEEALPLLPQYAMARVSRKSLLQACLFQAAQQAVRDLDLAPERTCITLWATRLSREMCGGVLSLARCMRTVRLHLQTPSPQLPEQLLQQYGIVCGGRLPEDVTQLHVVCDLPAPEDGLLADLTEEGVLPQQDDVWRPALCAAPEVLRKCPEGVPQEDFLAALYLSGGITAGDITVERKQNLP